MSLRARSALGQRFTGSDAPPRDQKIVPMEHAARGAARSGDLVTPALACTAMG
jgi:hypothetical protein